MTVSFLFIGCNDYDGYQSRKEVKRTIKTADDLIRNQPSPTDFDYSLERYNLIKRAYWVNGERDKARALPCPIKDMPLGYVVLLTNNGAVIGQFTVAGKITALSKWLSPTSEKYSMGSGYNNWLADESGTYGDELDGIFFFTAGDDQYIQYSGNYLYSDVPFLFDAPILKVQSTTK
jgi:hypothetical protein